MNQTLQKITTLIKVPSTEDNPQALVDALDLIESTLRKHPDVTIERFSSAGKPSLLAYNQPTRPERFTVLLNGHVDVVPAQPQQFQPTVTDDKLYGRGALDMKAAAVVLTEVFCDQAAQVEYPLGLQIVTDEETGGENGTLHQIQNGVDTEFLIAGEFTPKSSICNESRGLVWVTLDFKGRAAHSAYLHEGENAIQNAHDFITRLNQEIPLPPTGAWQTSVNIAAINSLNTAYNRVPDAAQVKIDIRYTSTDTRFRDEISTKALLRQLAPDAAITLEQFEPSHFIDPSSHYPQKLAQALKHVTGQPTSFIQKQGSADIRFFSERGIPAVVFGLRGGGQHSDDEWLDIESVEEYRQSLTVFLQNLPPSNNR